MRIPHTRDLFREAEVFRVDNHEASCGDRGLYRVSVDQPAMTAVSTGQVDPRHPNVLAESTVGVLPHLSKNRLEPSGRGRNSLPLEAIITLFVERHVHERRCEPQTSYMHDLEGGHLDYFELTAGQKFQCLPVA